MLFLWEQAMKLLTSTKSPSPKHRKLFAFRSPIERASLLALPCRKAAASMTVEAAMVLPLFLFFFLNLSCSIEMIRLHGNLQMALWDVGNRMCVYGYALEHTEQIQSKISDEEDRAWWHDLAGAALSYPYIKQEVINHAGRDYLDHSPLIGGAGGLHFPENSLFSAGRAAGAEPAASSGDILDIVMTYKVMPWLEIPAVPSFGMANRYYGHLWTGYGIGSDLVERNQEADMVYITENASVYHESLECTHLKLTIREVTMEEALESRNEYGRRYRKCSKCGDKPFCGTVFIGKDGDYYHYDRDCSGLKRTIHTISRQEAAATYRPCSRCASAR